MALRFSSRALHRAALSGATRLGAAAAALLAIRFVALGWMIVGARWDYPYELEWMEGGSLAHVLRVLEGRPLYAEPSAEWVPFLYHPFYYYAALPFVGVLGVGLPALRALSAVCHLAILLLLGRLAWTETKSPWAALVAPGVYSGTFALQGAWFDIARVDGLMLALVLGGALLLREGKTLRSAAVAAGLLYLAVMTKQIAAVLAAPLILYALLASWRRGLLAGGLLGGLMLLTMGYLEWSSAGWYRYYCFTLAGSHEWDQGQYVGFWVNDLRPLLPALGLSVLLPFQWLGLPKQRHGLGFVALLVLGTVVVGYLSRLHTGGYLNVLQPTCAGLALGLAVAAFPKRQARPRGLPVLFAALAALQLYLLDYDTAIHIPRAENRADGAQLVAELEAIEGDIYAPELMSYAILAGAPALPHAIAVEDILRGGPPEPRQAFLDDLNRAVDERRFGAILLGARSVAGSSVPILGRGYRGGRRVTGPATFTGMGTLPSRVMLPR